ncbi:MAG TPA: ATPase, partial [Methanothrix soehngenii]|nr:ATPase [Methanothrix soehngenii]
MAQRGIREYDAKNLLARYLPEYLDDFSYKGNLALVGPETDIEGLEAENPWLKTTRLVVKPDQLFGKRGKLGLVLLDADWEEAKEYLNEKMGLEVTIGGITGRLSYFLIEPFTPHKEEYYVAISSDYEGDNIFFSMDGGVGVEENWEKVISIHVDSLEGIDALDVGSKLPAELGDKRALVEEFITALWRFYSDTGFAYVE